ncbi:MAG: hypothetical protein HYX42_12230 [Polaromonas sp.]|uniref:hypothetical protein n=1 Tax=Polaromonas sp. TaxID=1869339 RepID=UPI0025EC8744|nr:hypothetical protein [Polaromonas sp.]MBI2727004.1 hypothetical protein [Polaromonas sp.]
MKSIIASAALIAAMSPAFAQMYNSAPDPCTPVFAACEAAGYSKDETAPAGKKIFAECGGPLMHGKKVEGVKVDAKVAARCTRFKADKDKFEKKWQLTNK